MLNDVFRPLAMLWWLASLGLLVAGCGDPAPPDPLIEPPSTSVGATEAVSVPTTATTGQTESGARLAEPAVVADLVKPLWLGWYTAVAEGDVGALDETIARTQIHNDGAAAIESGELEFSRAPSNDAYVFEVLDVLRDDGDCIVTAIREDPSEFLVGGTAAERIGVYWPHEGRWLLATSWTIDTPAFAWSDDCDLMVRSFG